MEITNTYLNIITDLVVRIPGYLAANYFLYHASDYINTYGFNCYEVYIFDYKGYRIALTRGAKFKKKIVKRLNCMQIIMKLWVQF